MAIQRLGRQTAQGRQARRTGERAATILEVALRLFASQGYTAVSIKDIAKASRSNSALIYYYFANKEHLFVKALRHSVQAALSRRRFDGRAGDPVSEINIWFDTNEKMAKPLGQMLRLMMDYRASQGRSASARRLIGDFYQTELELLKRAMDEGIEQGVFQPVDTAKTSLFVSTHLDGLLFASAVRLDYNLGASMRQLRQVLFAYLGYGRVTAGRRKNSSPRRLRAVA